MSRDIKQPGVLSGVTSAPPVITVSLSTIATAAALGARAGGGVLAGNASHATVEPPGPEGSAVAAAPDLGPSERDLMTTFHLHETAERWLQAVANNQSAEFRASVIFSVAFHARDGDRASSSVDAREDSEQPISQPEEQPWSMVASVPYAGQHDDAQQESTTLDKAAVDDIDGIGAAQIAAVAEAAADSEE